MFSANQNILPPDVSRALRPDSVLIFPTETLYGIGCSILHHRAVERIFKIKGRELHQPPPVLIADATQLSTLVSYISPQAQTLMKQYWPGSLTLILPARDEVPELLRGTGSDGKTRTIGVRQTAHPIARALCAALQAPLIATSANFSGATGRAAMPHSLDDIPDEFKQRVDVVVDGGEVGGLPSTIADCVSSPPRILRAGAVTLPEWMNG